MPANLLAFPSNSVDPEREVICRAICGCDGAHNGTQRVSQWCVTLALWEFDKGLGYKSTIKADVPYDMSKNPPVPIMSRNIPGRPTHGKPGGSEAPDVVIVWNPNRPPTQDNIRKVYEIKFGRDSLDSDKRIAYEKIAGGAPFEVLRPEDCGCRGGEWDPLPEPISAKDAAEIILLLLMVAALLADDAVPGGQADDPVLAPTISRLLARLSSLVSKLRPIPVPVPVPF
jgi:type VI secretion system secreted protein VgrG